MIVLITIICCLIIAYFIIAPKNMVIWYFSLYSLSFMVIVFSGLLFFFKLSNYPNLYELDYTLYLYLIRFKLPLSTARYIFTGGVTALLLSNIFFMNIIKLQNRSILTNTLLILPLVAYFFLNNPKLMSTLDITMHTTTSVFVKNVLTLLPTFTGYYIKLLIILYHIIPICIIIKHCISTNITVKKKSLIITLICTILLYTNILHMILGSLNTYFTLDFNSFPVYNTHTSKYIIMLTMFVFMVTLIFSLLVFFQPFRNYTIISGKTKRKNKNISSSNLRMFFHMQKNLFVVISKFSNLDEEECKKNPQRAYNNLQMIKNLSDSTIDTLSDNLNMIHSPKIMPEKTSVYDVIDPVIKNLNIPNNIIVDKEYPEDSIYCLSDVGALSEAFANIFSNAIEAIEMSHCPNGRITIRITDDYDLVCITIKDNGCGIDKKNLKYLFDPLFSTKSTRKNYGLGLSYAKDVIIQHNGYITIDSTVGVGTSVQITLPKLKERRFLHGKYKSCHLR